LGLEKVNKSFMRSGKILLHLAPCPSGTQEKRPVPISKFSYVRLSFRQGADDDFYKKYKEVLDRKQWTMASTPSTPSTQGRVTPRAGIVGIERKLAEQHTRTSQNISQAFEDLSKLMDMAKEMVDISKSISEKIRLKQGDITEDETVRFKSYLMSLGVSDPVTKATYGAGSRYNEELAKELANVLAQPLKECGGMMTLPDVFCRINRARGLELLSPEDLLNACMSLEKMDLPIKMHCFESGVMVLQLSDYRVEKTVEDTCSVVSSSESVNAEEFAALIGISVILGRERLVAAEKSAGLCRDETVEGLRFFPNRFLSDGTNQA
jgi:ESCRT-II complex subunit VPS36